MKNQEVKTSSSLLVTGVSALVVATTLSSGSAIGAQSTSDSIDSANPFVSVELATGYQLSCDAGDMEGKCGEGKCGEGKCGGSSDK